jgi:hypothetical protein
MDFYKLIEPRIHFGFGLLPYHDRVEEGSSMIRLDSQHLLKLAGILLLSPMRQ